MKLPLIAWLSAGLALVSAPVWAQQQTVVTVTPERAVQSTTSLVLPLNKSRVMRVNAAIGKISTGNADIVDVVALTDRSFYVLGKGLGTTNLALYGQDNQLLAVIDVTVSIDVDSVKAALHTLLPGERIDVHPINDTIALGGTLSSAAKTHEAMDIAKRFVYKDGIVLNEMNVVGTQQVMLQVKVAEMDRSIASAFGFHPAALLGSVAAIGIPTGALNALNTSNLATSLLAGTGSIGKSAVQFSDVMEALENKGSIKVLAEPNLVALSGDTASFLAGGEFPVPVAYTPATGASSVPTITIQFKPFGVSLSFTPTVLEDRLINMVVVPEVSQIDTANSVVANGITIPGIATRRVKTSVEVHDGESFAIAGLLAENFADQVQGVPGLVNLPILGAMFRDSNFQRKQTELVIIVTPRLVHPTVANALRAPTDSFVPPSEQDIFFNGRREAPESGRPQGGGLAGSYGHIIR